MADPVPQIDAVSLIRALRTDDRSVIEQAYRQVFGTRMGSLVLAHALKEAQVGAQRQRGLSSDERAFMDGCAFAIIGLAEMAGFDQASIVLGLYTNQMEGPVPS